MGGTARVYSPRGGVLCLMCNHCSAHNIDIAAPSDDFHDVAGANLSFDERVEKRIQRFREKKASLLAAVVETARSLSPGCISPWGSSAGPHGIGGQTITACG